MKIFNKLEIFILFLSSVKLSSTFDIGVCFDGNLKSCCQNYYQVNDICEECPPGTFGEKCSQNCYSGFYGRLCLSKCNCKSINETCDAKVGCKVCPSGSYGEKCSLECPNGTYGSLCKEECTCETGCDKVIGCIKSESPRNLYEILMYTLATSIPVIPICLCIFFMGKCIQQKHKRKKSSAKNFVDIPPYDVNLHRMPSSTNILHDAISDETPVDEYATIKTEEETGLRNNKEELDDGEYHTLTLRVTGYEEPVTKKRLLRRYSDSSSTYMKSSACNSERSADGYYLSYKCKRSSSLRIKNIDRKENYRENKPAQTMEDEERDKESVHLPFHRNYIYDVATPIEHDKTVVNLNHKELFLKELSSHLLNFKKI